MLICWWLGGVFVILWSEGVHFKWFDLDKDVLLALIGGTTVNVVGLMYIVMHYLFPNDSKASPLK
jgi:hypothetical protein